MTRLAYYDFIKGILIVFVIVGHILQGTTHDNFLRYLIYSFHMPVFAGLGGYFFFYSSILDKPLKLVLKKYFIKLIIPWIIAVFLYSIVNNHSYLNLTLRDIIYLFIKPFYHLWYVPAFITWVLFVWISNKLQLSSKTLLFVGFIISMLSIILFYYKIEFQYINIKFISVIGIHAYSVVQNLLNIFRPHFLIFFIFGFLLGKRKFEIKYVHYIFVTIAIVNVLLFFLDGSILSPIIFTLMNLLLIYIIVLFSNRFNINSLKVEWLGRNSFGLYLWHMLPILVVKNGFGVENKASFYFVSTIFIFIFLFLFYYLSKSNLFRIIFLGESKK